MLKIIRFVLPFLFERNWHTGTWEVSRLRLFIFGGLTLIVIIVITIAFILQSPVEYLST